MDARPAHTLTSEPAAIATHEEAVEKPRALKDRIRGRLSMGQEMRRLPNETVAEIVESGLCGLMFGDRLGSKIATAENVNSPFPPGGMAQTMSRLAHAAAALDSCRALMHVNARRFGRRPIAQMSREQNMRLHRDIAFVAQEARRSANMLFEESGGSALAEKNPIQQFWRDTNAAAAHRGLMWDWQGALWTKSALGVPLEQPI